MPVEALSFSPIFQIVFCWATDWKQESAKSNNKKLRFFNESDHYRVEQDLTFKMKTTIFFNITTKTYSS